MGKEVLCHTASGYSLGRVTKPNKFKYFSSVTNFFSCAFTRFSLNQNRNILLYFKINNLFFNDIDVRSY